MLQLQKHSPGGKFPLLIFCVHMQLMHVLIVCCLLLCFVLTLVIYPITILHFPFSFRFWPTNLIQLSAFSLPPLANWFMSSAKCCCLIFGFCVCSHVFFCCFVVCKVFMSCLLAWPTDALLYKVAPHCGLPLSC